MATVLFSNFTGVSFDDDLVSEINEATAQDGQLPEDLAQLFSLVRTEYKRSDGSDIWVLWPR